MYHPKNARQNYKALGAGYNYRSSEDKVRDSCNQESVYLLMWTGASALPVRLKAKTKANFNWLP